MKRYFSSMARKYHRIDFWLKSGVGFIGLIGVTLTGYLPSNHQWIGLFLSGVSVFTLGNLLPLFKWDDIVNNFKQEQLEWTALLEEYEKIKKWEESSLDEMTIIQSEFARIKERHNRQAQTERYLPINKCKLTQYELEVREFYK